MSRCTRSLWAAQVALLVMVTAGLGCGEFRKAQECSALSKTVASWIAETPTPDAGLSARDSIAADARATARRYEALDRTLSDLDIRSEDLVAPVARYRDMATGAARVLDEVALALEHQDADLARRRRVEFDATVEAERVLVAEINAVCKR